MDVLVLVLLQVGCGWLTVWCHEVVSYAVVSHKVVCHKVVSYIVVCYIVVSYIVVVSRACKNCANIKGLSKQSANN